MPVVETGRERKPRGDQRQIHDEGTCNKYEPKGASLVGCPNPGQRARLSEEGGRVGGRAAKEGLGEDMDKLDEGARATGKHDLRCRKRHPCKRKERRTTSTTAGSSHFTLFRV